jgi:hypothetical protein
MADPIEPALARKLDAFTVPALPADFADRVMAGLDPATTPPLPRLRKARARRWWRVGGSALGAIVAATISISAAASGYLGEPIRQAVASAPVIGPVVERVVARQKPVRAVQAAARARPVAAKPPVAPASIAAPALNRFELRAQRQAELRQRVRERIAKDPEAARQWLADHPRAARRIAQRQALRDAAADGDPRAARQPARERRRERLGVMPRTAIDPLSRGGDLRPGLRAERRERLRLMRERRLRRMEMRDGAPAGDPPPDTAPVD